MKEIKKAKVERQVGNDYIEEELREELEKTEKYLGLGYIRRGTEESRALQEYIVKKGKEAGYALEIRREKEKGYETEVEGYVECASCPGGRKHLRKYTINEGEELQNVIVEEKDVKQQGELTLEELRKYGKEHEVIVVQAEEAELSTQAYYYNKEVKAVVVQVPRDFYIQGAHMRLSITRKLEEERENIRYLRFSPKEVIKKRVIIDTSEIEDRGVSAVAMGLVLMRHTKGVEYIYVSRKPGDTKIEGVTEGESLVWLRAPWGEKGALEYRELETEKGQTGIKKLTERGIKLKTYGRKEKGGKTYKVSGLLLKKYKELLK